MSGPAVTTCTIPLRWADTDALGHIWHGIHLSLIEEARTAWLNGLCDSGETLWDHAVIRVEIDFRAELGYDDGHAVVSCEGTGFGTKSVRTHERVCTPRGVLVAEAHSVVVAWEPATHTTRTLRDDERTLLAARCSSGASDDDPTAPV